MRHEIGRFAIADVKITLLNTRGKLLKPGDLARVCNFTIEGPGIDPKRVRYVRIPELNYTKNEPVVIEVGMLPYDPEEAEQHA